VGSQGGQSALHPQAAQYLLSGGTLIANGEWIGYGNNSSYGDTADFNQTGSSQNGSMTAPIAMLEVGYGPGSVGTYELGNSAGTDNPALYSNYEVIGNQGSGTFTQNSGSNTITAFNSTTPGELQVGVNGENGAGSTTNGKYILNGGTLSVPLESVGALGGSGAFIQTGNSTNSTEQLTLGGQGSVAGSGGTYSLSGGTLLVTSSGSIVGSEFIGNTAVAPGGADFYQSGGFNGISSSPVPLISLAGSYILNSTVESSAVYAVTEQIYGVGSFTQSGNGNSTTNTVSSNLYVGYQSSGSGSYYLQGGTLSVPGNEYVGYQTTNGNSGDFEQTGVSENGTSGTPVGLLDVGCGASSIGTYKLGTGSDYPFLFANTEVIGDNGKGTFTQNSGANTVTGNLIVGNQEGSTAQYTLSEGSLTTQGNEYVGFGNNAANGDTAVFTQNTTYGSSSNSFYLLDVANGVGSIGKYELDGGTISGTSEIIGAAGNGTFTQTGGSNTTSLDLIVGNSSGSNGTYNMSGGAQLQTGQAQIAASTGSAGSVNVDGSGTYFEASTLSVGGNASVAGAQGSFTLTHGSTAHVAVKATTGTNGTIDVADNGGGGLTIGSTSTLAANGTVLVNSGGTLGGAGTVIGNVVNNGTVAPGDPVKLTLNGNYHQTAAGVLVLDIAGASSYDQLNVQGQLALDPGATLKLDFIDGFLPTAGETFNDLISYQSIVGSFSTVAVEGLPAGDNYNLSSVGGNFELSVVAVPEPSSGALMLASLGLLTFWRLRSHRATFCQFGNPRKCTS
jgi:hypothetical protein